MPGYGFLKIIGATGRVGDSNQSGPPCCGQPGQVAAVDLAETGGTGQGNPDGGGLLPFDGPRPFDGLRVLVLWFFHGLG